MSFKPQAIETNKDWIKVISPSRKKRKYDNIKNSLEVRNSFQVLQNCNEEDEEIDDFSQTPTDTTKGKVKIPPIVVYSHVQEHMKTLNLIKENMKSDFDIKAKNNRIIVYTKNEEDYNTFLKETKVAKVDYHTYTFPNKKIIKSILKGVPANVSTDEIYEDLKVKNNLKVLEVKQMSAPINIDNNEQKQTKKLPVFIVTFEPTVQISEIMKVRRVCYCVVSWEKFRSNGKITKCYNFQVYGHVSSNCFRKPKCMKCSGEHKSKECTIVDNNQFKCADCNLKHLANSKECPIYSRLNNQKTYNVDSKRQYKFNTRNVTSSVVYNEDIHDKININSKLGNKSYRDAVNHPRNVNRNNQQKEDDLSSFTNFISVFKSLFSNFNLTKMNKLKCCNDNFSRISCLIEGILEIFD